MSINLINYNETNNLYLDRSYYFEVFIKNIILADRYLKTKSGKKYKIIRCNNCIQCQQKQDCLKCRNCLNKTKLGGNGTRKQGCIFKKCLNPTKICLY